MYYWNDANFEGLLAVAEALEAHPALAPLAEYCRLREKGLRKDAFRSLESFLTSAQAWPQAKARRATIEILETQARVADAHQFMSQPVWDKLVLPTLTSWHAESPEEWVAMRWLGLVERQEELLRRALALEPGDFPVRKVLAQWALDRVGYATHHLGESRFLGEVDDAERALRDARELLVGCPEQAGLEYLRQKLLRNTALIADWKTFSEEGTGTFPEWCASQGRDYQFTPTYYYTK